MRQECRQLAALQGIGYAVLALDERLGGLLDAAEDGSFQLAQIEEAIEDLHPAARRRRVRDLLWRLAWPCRGSRRAAGRAAPVFTAADHDTVLRALADAAASRCWRADQDADTSVADTELAAGYEELRVRMGGGVS